MTRRVTASWDDMGDICWTHLVVDGTTVLANCGIRHDVEHNWDKPGSPGGCDVADNWVLVRPGLHSSA